MSRSSFKGEVDLLLIREESKRQYALIKGFKPNKAEFLSVVFSKA